MYKNILYKNVEDDFPKFEENEALGVLHKLYLNPLYFLRAHGALEEFVLILGVAIEEEKILMYFKVYKKIGLLHRATAV